MLKHFNYVCDAIVFVLSCIGAAIGPQLAGILSRNSWNNVFYMMIAAEFAAVLVRVFSFCPIFAKIML